MIPALNITHSEIKGYIGPAAIDSKTLDDAIDYLKMGASHIQSGLQAPHEIIKSWSKENRFYIELDYVVEHLNPSLPPENLLLNLHQQVVDLGIVGKHIDLRFEKGCIGASANFWHKDFRENDSIKVLSLSYSNLPEWSTKILDDKTGLIASLSSNTGIYNTISPDIYNKCEEISENSELGTIYNVCEIWHRSPVKTDLPNPPQENDSRLFIKFNDRK